MYMSYCRFEGTRRELTACLDVVEDHINKEAKYEVSEQEINHFRRMTLMFAEFMLEQGIINFDGEIDKAVLENVCSAMAKSYEQDKPEYEDWEEW